MQQQTQVHRHLDGSIDFDFYRRRAARQHRLIKRLLIARTSALISRMLTETIGFVTDGLLVRRRLTNDRLRLAK